MTAASDLDLILIYDFDAKATMSSGLKPLPITQYYTRLTQRLISAFTAPTAEGILYEVDMRLRPSGQKGPVATQLSSFIHYQTSEAWTWEHMALTRARVISGPPALRAAVEKAIRDVLVEPRDRAKTRRRRPRHARRIEKEKGTRDPWELKQVRGGLVDLEFIAQHLQLVHGPAHPQVLSQNYGGGAHQNPAEAGLLRPAAAEALAAGRPPPQQSDPGAAALPRWPLRAGQGAGRPQSRCWRAPARPRISGIWRPIWLPARREVCHTFRPVNYLNSG